jgi:peptidyl-prolyl cis-trans isomerase C
MVLAVASAGAAEVVKEPAAKPAGAGKALFADDVLCKGKGIEIKRSQLDEAFTQFRANVAVRGQTVPEEKRDLYETQLLDRLVVSRLLVSRATDEDRKKAREQADKFVAETKKQAGSDESFQRQLKAMSFSAEQFDAQVLERAVCEEVVDRELRAKVQITDEQAKKYYDENGDRFERPEMVRASHILLSTRDAVTGQELSGEKKKEKRQQIEKLLERAKKGEDFAALAKEFSEDPGSKDTGGEYTFPRGQMVPEFEEAAFSLKPNEISGVVTTQFGYHIVKLHEKTPAQKTEFAKVEKDLKEFLSRQEVQEKMLPDFLKRIKKEANLEYLNGAKPPESPDGQPQAKPTDK